MDMKQDGVRVFCLPERAYCKADDAKRCPLDIKECPLGYEECDGNCFYYTEESTTHD